MRQKIHTLKQSFRTDSLAQNSFYLMLSSLVQAGLGFAFWILNARLFTPEEVGQASGLIAAMTMISFFSLLGFNSTFVRFLPTAKDKNDNINTGILLVLACGLVLSVGYVVLLPVLAPELGFVRDNWGMTLGFVGMASFAAINLLTDSVFIAYRAAKYNLYVYSAMSSIKLALPVLLAGLGGYGIFAAQGLAGVIALAISVLFMVKYFTYRPEWVIKHSVIRQVLHFSSGNYVANLLNILPPVVLPIIIINKLGAEPAGYFYLAYMVANLLYTVSYSVSQSLFAEGSYGEVAMRRLIKRSVALLAAIMIPGSIALAAGGPLLMKLFGESYSDQAGQLLVAFAVGAPAVAFYITTTVLMRIYKQIKGLLVVNVVYAVSIVGLGFVGADKGLVWIGLAWGLGHLLAGMASLPYLFRHKTALTT